MTEEKQEIADVSSIFGTTDDVTGEQLLHNQNVSDENLALKTEVRDPVILTVLDAFAYSARKKGYLKTSALLDAVLKCLRENMVSYNRQGRQEFKDSWVALMETNMRKKEGLADQIFGGSKR